MCAHSCGLKFVCCCEENLHGATNFLTPQDLHLPYKHFATGLASHDRLSNDIQEFICHSWQWKEEFDLWVIHGIHWGLMQIIQFSAKKNLATHLAIDLLLAGVDFSKCAACTEQTDQLSCPLCAFSVSHWMRYSRNSLGNSLVVICKPSNFDLT